MKKLSILALALSSALWAQSAQGLHIGAGVGLEAMPKGFDNGAGLSLRGGAELNQLLEYLGAEAELTTSLIAPKVGGKKLNVFTMALYTNYTIAIPGSSVSVRPKFGVILPNLGDDIHSRGIALSTGIAALLKVNEQMSTFVEYTNASEWMNNYMIGVEIAF